jgi:hypothetical protein
MNLDSHQSLQMVAFVSGDGLGKAVRRLVLCQLTALVAVVWWCGEECITQERPLDCDKTNTECTALLWWHFTPCCGAVHAQKLHLLFMPLMIFWILHDGMAFHSMMSAFSNACRELNGWRFSRIRQFSMSQPYSIEPDQKNDSTKVMC